MTRRQDIITLIREKPRTLRELIVHFGIDAKEILIDLNYIQRSLAAPDKFVVLSSECKKCGYVFKDRTKKKRPSKCPECKQEKITEPRFSIIAI